MKPVKPPLLFSEGVGESCHLGNFTGFFIGVDMEYLKIKNWEKWQTYRSDRGQPPWIKIHRRLMRNPEWISLTDAERGQLVAIWLLAADHDGAIPTSPDVIQKICYLDNPPNLNKLIELGFIEPPLDARATPERRHVDVDVTHQRKTRSRGRLEEEKERECEREIKKVDINTISTNNKKSKYGEFQNVFLTDEEITKLKEKFGKTKTLEKIETLSGYKASKGKTYKSDYATILTWARKEDASAAPRRAEIVHTCQEKCTKCGTALAVRDGLCKDCYGVVPMPDYFREVFDKAVKPMP